MPRGTVCLVPGPALDDQPTPAHAQPAATPAPGAASATAPSRAAAEAARPTEALIAPVAAEVASTRSGTDEAPAGGADAAAPRSAPLASALFCCNVQRGRNIVYYACCLRCVATSCTVLFAMCRDIVHRAVCDVSRHRAACCLRCVATSCKAAHRTGRVLGFHSAPPRLHRNPPIALSGIAAAGNFRPV